MTRFIASMLGWMIFLSFFPAVAVSADLKLGSDVWPPFTDKAGQPRVAIELVHEALTRAGYGVKTEIQDFETVIQGLGMGNFDGSAALWKDPDREKFMYFSAAYLENRLVLVGRKDSDVKAASFTDLAGAKVAVVAGYSYGDTAKEGSGPIFVEGTSDQDNLLRLLDGQVDYMLVDELLISRVVNHQPDEAKKNLEIGTEPLIRRSLHFALNKGLAGAETIIANFNTAIQEMIADGTFNRILGLNWIRADVDGDGKLELVHGEGGAGTAAPTTGYSVAADDTTSSEVDRFWVEGQMYQSWDEVPERYKYSGPKEEGTEGPGMSLFRKDF